MKYKLINLEKKQSAFIVTLNDPKRGNSLSPPMLDELIHLLDQIREGKVDFRGLIFTGMGANFSSGFDWELMNLMGQDEGSVFFSKASELSRKIFELPYPVLACVAGQAWGPGFEFALNCDFIYSTQSANFRLPEVDYGLVPGFGGCRRLVKWIGPGRAKELIFSGESLSASEAKKLNIVNKVFETKEEMMKEARLRVENIAKKSPKALSLCKGIIGQVIANSEETINKERQAFLEALASQEKKEGMNALREKREPRYDYFLLNH